MDDGANKVVRVWPAEPGLLADFLNDMQFAAAAPASQGTNGIPEASASDPSTWGALVLSRSAEGDILFIDPELYWNGISELFRTRGDDPHPWRGRS